MALKIIKTGILPEDKRYNSTCYTCGTEVEGTNKDGTGQRFKRLLIFDLAE